MYGKLFTQMYDGTLGTEGPWEALVTFQQMIILADQDGVVDMTAEALSRRTTIPLDVIRKGIAALEKPDPHSRTPDEEGRRIVRLSETRDWGWRLVNHGKYRAIRSAEDRRQYHRDYWHKRAQQDSTDSTATQQTQPIAKAEANTKAEKKGRAFALPEWVPEENWKGFVEMRSRKHPLTPRGKSLVVGELERLRAVGEDVAAVLDQSTMNGWRGVFPVRKEVSGGPSRYSDEWIDQEVRAGRLKPRAGETYQQIRNRLRA